MSDLTNGLLPLLGEELSLRWIITLLHFLWQGTVVGLVAAVVGSLLRYASASIRYSLFSMALLSLPLCVAVTFIFIKVPLALQTSIQPSSLLVAVESTGNQQEAFPQVGLIPERREEFSRRNRFGKRNLLPANLLEKCSEGRPLLSQGIEC